MWLDFAQIANDYEIHIFFSRYVRSFVPPWFDETAAEIQRNTGRDFKRIWGWAFDQFMNATNTAYELGTVGRYSFGLYGDMALGATSRISEIYRTSFVSTVDWFARQGWLDESFAAEYCLKICPLDPSLWEIGYSSKPEWWPNAGAEAEITMITEWSACESLVELRQQNFRLFVAEGTITPNPDRPLISTAFRLLPFAYRVHGREILSAESVAALIGRAFWQKAPTAPRPICMFEGSFSGWVPFFQRTAQAKDLEVLPLIARIHNTNINQWHPWRGVHLPFFPALSLIDGGRPDHDNFSWVYRNEADSVTFRASDWKTGTLERINTNKYMLHGQYAFADQEWLANRLEKENYRLGFVLSTFVKQRKDEYAEAKKMHQHQLLDFSPIIV